jgi:hypothetical protein
LKSLATILGLTNDLHVWLGIQHHFQTSPQYGMVIDE